DFITPTPTLTKSFGAPAITTGGTTTLTFTIDNTPAQSTLQTGIAFTDTLPSGLQLASGAVGGTCAGYTITDGANAALGPGSTSVKVTGLSLAAGLSCTIVVTVTNQPQQLNQACPNAPAFTNNAGSISNLSGNLQNGVQ